MSEVFDLLVVGGGINGVGIARDAAGRGLKVLLCERGDLAGATSSASSKLVHGGLRYLEHYAFRLVRESLVEREILLRMAPHLVRPTRFVLPHGPGARPRWLIRAGLFLYDRIGGARSLPASRSLDLRHEPAGAPLIAAARHGFSYSDCRVDDARLVVVTARDAALRGADIRTRTTVVGARRDGGVWRAVLREEGGIRQQAAARILVNTAGPWVAEVARFAGIAGKARLRLVKGSHIVVPRLFEHDHAYIFQNADNRVLFAIPYEHDFTLIGTTDLPFAGDPATAGISSEEIAYLCGVVGRWFRRPPAPADIVWSYAGVRPLYDDGTADAAAVTRDYVFELDAQAAPALSVFGGKLTTYRRLAEHALDRLAPFLPAPAPPWTAASVLPGGEGLPPGGTVALAALLRREQPALDAATATRLAGAYGSDARTILAAGPGADLGLGFSEAELRWLVEREWARTPEDVLWRRGKLGLAAGPVMAAAVAAGLARLVPGTGPLAARRSDAPQRR